jgi:predicted metal-dependent hydrolase
VPRSAGEYVIGHELVHLLAPNHGKVLKSFMAAYLPDWEEREKMVVNPTRMVSVPRDVA